MTEGPRGSEAVPGEVPPPDVKRRLARAPGERFSGPDAGAAERRAGSIPRGIAAAAGVGLVGAALLVLLAGPLAADTPLVVVGLLTGAVVGEAIQRGTADAMDPGHRRIVALAIALAAIGGAEVVVWQLALAEGGVLPLLTYLLDTFGPIAPLTIVAAVAAAVWRAA
jgi:hypothetical protein